MARRGEEILLLAASGLTDKEIAEQLRISVRTVEGHWRRLREHTGQPNRAGVLGEMLRQKLAETETRYQNQIQDLESQVRQVENLREQVRNQQTELQNEARRHSRALHEELNRLYAEVNRLKDENQGAGHLQAIVLKSSVLAYRVELEAPHRCTFISESVRTLGYRPQEFTQGGLTPAAFVHPEDFAYVWAESLARIRAGAERLDRRYRLVSRNGDVRWVIDRCAVERAVAEQPDTVCTFVFDVTHLGAEAWLADPHTAYVRS